MITKNISGQPLSANYSSTVLESSRDWEMQLYFNGSPLDCGIKSVTIKKGSCGSTESFSIGNIYSSMMTAELIDLETEIKNEDIEVRIGLDTGSMEWITLGWFTAVEVVKSVKFTKVTAYGFSASKTLGSFVIPQTLTLRNIANAIQAATGRTVSFGSGIITSYTLAGSLESGINCYTGLQILARAVGGYVMDTNDGNFLINRFSNTPTLSISTEQMKALPEIEELPFIITGVQVTATGQYRYFRTSDVSIDPEKTYYTYNASTGQYVEVDEPEASLLSTYYERTDITYTHGSPVILYDENPNMSAGVFDIYKTVVGYSFYTASIGLTLGDPRIEGDDVLSVNVDGMDYAVPCHNLEHRYDGGLSTSIEAVKSSAEGTDLIQNGPISQQVDTIRLASAIAKSSAESAVKSAETAKRSADTAYSLALQVETLAGEANRNAASAQESADSALLSSTTAYAAANGALRQLGVVEDVIGVIDLISKNGDYKRTGDPEFVPEKWYFTRSGVDPNYVYSLAAAQNFYRLTEDTSIVEGKTYYTRSGTAPNYTYTPVANPVVEDIGTYYEMYQSPAEQELYELVSVDQSIQNYVSSHLVLSGNTLSLRTDNSDYRLDLTSKGVEIIGPNGLPIATYGVNTIVGRKDGFHIKIDGSELGFYNGVLKIAYMSKEKLYIPQSVVLEQMDVGLPYGHRDPVTQEQDGFGQWSWKLHLNNENPPRNNLNLKWIG